MRTNSLTEAPPREARRARLILWIVVVGVIVLNTVLFLAFLECKSGNPNPTLAPVNTNSVAGHARPGT